MLTEPATSGAWTRSADLARGSDTRLNESAHGTTGIVNRLRRLLNHLPRKTQDRLYRFCKRYVDDRDCLNDDDMLTNGEYAVLRTFLPSSRVVFDVGANVGNWSSSALAINPGLTLYCFEPAVATFEALSRRKLPGTVVINNFGLSSANCDVDLFVSAVESGITSIYRRTGIDYLGERGLPTERQRACFRRMDEYCYELGLTIVDFCKIDVEGHEMSVLSGMGELLREQRVRAIQFEYGGCNIDANTLLRDFFTFFEHLPYDLYKICACGLRRYGRYDARLENFQYQNWLAVTPGFLETARGNLSNPIALCS